MNTFGTPLAAALYALRHGLSPRTRRRALDGGAGVYWSLTALEPKGE